MTEREALNTAKSYGLEEEVRSSIKDGMSPEDALTEWDICLEYTESYF